MEDCVVPLTQGSSRTNYGWVILYLWADDQEDNPFRIVSLRRLQSKDFPMKHINGSLVEQDRLQVHKLQCFDGNKYSIFCKIQIGKLT